MRLSHVLQVNPGLILILPLNYDILTHSCLYRSLPSTLGYHIHVLLGKIFIILLIVNYPFHQGQGVFIFINLGQHVFLNNIHGVIYDSSVWELNIIDHGAHHWVVIILYRHCSIQSKVSLDHIVSLEVISMLKYNFIVDKLVIGWLLIDQPAIYLHCILNISNSSWIFIIILIFFPLLFDLRFIGL